jgi:hypothetical protein
MAIAGKAYQKAMGTRQKKDNTVNTTACIVKLNGNIFLCKEMEEKL